MKKSTYIDSIFQKPVSHTPIWIMRQAGRYLPEYMDIRNKSDFMTLCRTPELATEVTLQPIRRFGMDAAILFSDILVIPEAMGQRLEFMKNHGPKLSPVIRTAQDVAALETKNITEKLKYVADAITMIRSELDTDIPLIGFSGSPFTLAVYMIEGGGSKNFSNVKRLMYTDPDAMRLLLEIVTNAVIEYLKMQKKAGVQALQVFDTWGGIIPPHLFEEFSGTYMRRIVTEVQTDLTPVTLFSKGGINILKSLSDSNAAMLGVDWMTSMKEAKAVVANNCALQGNMDPTALYGSNSFIKSEVKRVLDVFTIDGEIQSGLVFNLGHGILPDMRPEKVEYLVNTVHELSVR